jgi:septal ring factor EnvC (AmiA/AmiB activator)
MIKKLPLAKSNFIRTLSLLAKIPVLILSCPIILLSFSPGNATEHQYPVEEKEIELESIRTQIKSVQTKIIEAQSSVGSYLNELQENEITIMNITINLESIDTNIQHQLEILGQLQIERLEQEKVLNEERELLANQIRVSYKTGRHDFLKLLLNQENPEKIGRMMTYHDYYNRARSERISEIQITINNLQQLVQTIDTETRKLGLLKDQQINKYDQLAKFGEERNAIINDLNQYISQQDQELSNLQQDEQELESLLNNLKNNQNVVELYENLPPFDSLKAKLNWPVSGKIITKYGSAKKDGKLRWNGVKISAVQGNEVASISAGKVIFADWFRNLGLLIIIDHGNGYMSLYGHNERLLKKTDDFVSTNEAIAKVGNTGGQSESALYFEIRQQGTPLNPALWCQR